MSQPLLSGLSETERTTAFERLNSSARNWWRGLHGSWTQECGHALRTATRWAGQYRREGLAGLARKGRSDPGERRLSDTLHQAIEDLALRKRPLSVPAIHRPAVAEQEPTNLT